MNPRMVNPRMMNPKMVNPKNDDSKNGESQNGESPVMMDGYCLDNGGSVFFLGEGDFFWGRANTRFAPTGRLMIMPVWRY